MQAIGNDDNLLILSGAINYLKIKKRFAIATVVDTWGSSPRPIGSQMLVTDSSEIIGSVSGGCIESAVIEESFQIMKGASPKKLNFNVSNERAWEVGLTCGGKVSVYIETDEIESKIYESMMNAIQSRKFFTIIKDLTRHNNFLYFGSSQKISNPEIKKFVSTIEHKNLKTGMFEDGKWFIQSYTPKPKIIIIGAVHIAQHLEKMCDACGFSIEIIDPRDTFASKKRFKIGKLINQWPDDYFNKNSIDNRTAIVTLTHDPKLDDPALFHALKSNAFYIGCLGSKKTHSIRVERLRKFGFKPNEIQKINGPVGLSINAKSPAEIAVSIISQIIQIKNNMKHL